MLTAAPQGFTQQTGAAGKSFFEAANQQPVVNRLKSNHELSHRGTADAMKAAKSARVVNKPESSRDG